MQTKTILVAPIHWGLGHATRCIPIIRKLLDHNFNVLLASDGAALQLLRFEFPQLPYIELPAYNITYPKNGKLFKWKILIKLPHLQRIIALERKIIESLVINKKIDGIISDSRFGVNSEGVPAVFITHQLNVLSGKTTPISTLLQQSQIKKFDACWIPDVEGTPNLSGRLGHVKEPFPFLRYIGPLSRMKNRNLKIQYDVLALLSGPEPQRALLEAKIIQELKNENRKTLLVQGVIESQQKWKQIDNVSVVNFMGSFQLEKSINESDIVIARSGYTTIMDLTAMEKKAYFIPTPGQYEQEYLAKRLKDLNVVPSCKQNQFTAEKLNEIEEYIGLKSLNFHLDFEKLFGFFEGKREL